MENLICINKAWHLVVIECIYEINRLNHGFPVIVNYILANVPLIIVLLFYCVIFIKNNDTENKNTFDIIEIIMNTVNIILLFMISHATVMGWLYY